MGEVLTNECDVFKTRSKNIKIYRIQVFEEGADTVDDIPFYVIEHLNVFWSPRALARAIKLIKKAVNPPGTRADNGKVAKESDGKKTD